LGAKRRPEKNITKSRNETLKTLGGFRLVDDVRMMILEPN
jgi:hypothetical protein